MLVRAIRDCLTAAGEYRKAGEEFDYSGPKNENLQSLKKAKADAEEAEAAGEEKAVEK